MEEVYDLEQARGLVAALRAEVERLGALNVQYITERNDARQEIARLEEELARTQRRVGDLTQQEAHWKANHDNLAKRNALLSQRPDLPVDRIPAHSELMVQLQADVMTKRKVLDIIERDGLTPTGYVLQGDAGKGACIVHMGAVRWLGDAELYMLMHPTAQA